MPQHRHPENVTLGQEARHKSSHTCATERKQIGNCLGVWWAREAGGSQHCDRMPSLTVYFQVPSCTLLELHLNSKNRPNLGEVCSILSSGAFWSLVAGADSMQGPFAGQEGCCKV